MILILYSLITIIFFYCISNLFFKKLYLSELEKPIFGCALFIITSNLIFFFLKIKFIYISYIFFILFFISVFFLKKKFVLVFFSKIRVIFPCSILILIALIVYGNQFFIFRGNIWDFFTYASVSKLVDNYSVKEIINLDLNFNIKKLENFYFIYKNEIFSRPSISFLSSFINSYSNLDYFESTFVIKLVSIFLSIISISLLVQKLTNKYFLIVIISNCFILSHFFFYNFEIDAYSLILSIPFLILLIDIVPNFKVNLIKNNNTYFIKFIILASSFFIIYPNSACIFLTIFLFFFLHQMYSFNCLKINYLSKLFLYFGLFLIIILPTFNSTIMYLLRSEIPSGLFNKVDFWGYYGAFVLGKDNPIYNKEVVKHIKELWVNNKSIFYIFYEVIKINTEIKNYFFPLNILPSIFGFYHFTTSVYYGYFNIIFIFILIYFNYLILNNFFNLFKNYKIYQEPYIIFYKIQIFIYFIFTIILIYAGQLWSVIKLFFFFSYLFYFFIILEFGKKKIKIRIFSLILLIILPFYKYSTYNHGLGTLDSYPSALNPNYKKEIIWSIDKNKLNSCKFFEDNLLDNKFAKLFISVSYEQKNKKNFYKECKVSIINKKFMIN